VVRNNPENDDDFIPAEDASEMTGTPLRVILQARFDRVRQENAPYCRELEAEFRRYGFPSPWRRGRPPIQPTDEQVAAVASMLGKGFDPEDRLISIRHVEAHPPLGLSGRQARKIAHDLLSRSSG
jgi:hypothetical protein